MRTWQCESCGTTYRVAWLSHCYRCEALPRAPKRAATKAPKGARPKGSRMPRIVAGVGPSNADEPAEEQPLEDVTEAELAPFAGDAEADSEPDEALVAEALTPAVEPDPAPVVSEPTPEAVEAPAPVQDAPVAAAKDGAL